MYLGLHDLQKRERKSSFSPFTHKLEPVHFSGMCNNIEEYVGAFCDIIRNRSQKSFSHTCTLVILSSPHISVCVAHQRAVVSCTAYHTRHTQERKSSSHTINKHHIHCSYRQDFIQRGGGSPPICSASPSEILNINQQNNHL